MSLNASLFMIPSVKTVKKKSKQDVLKENQKKHLVKAVGNKAMAVEKFDVNTDFNINKPITIELKND